MNICDTEIESGNVFGFTFDAALFNPSDAIPGQEFTIPGNTSGTGFAKLMDEGTIFVSIVWPMNIEQYYRDSEFEDFVEKGWITPHTRDGKVEYFLDQFRRIP